jgi:hypothetical protein
MPRSRGRVCTVLVAVVGATAAGHARIGAVPPSVANALAALTDECRRVDGIPHAEDAIRRADLNADGVEDFVLFAGWIVCENASSVYGDREKALAVFAGDGEGGAAQAFSELVYDASIESQGEAVQFWLTTSAERCGRPRAEVFADETFCDRAIVWHSDEARFEYTPLDSVRLID